MGVIERLPIWRCDRCGVEKESKSIPNTQSDPWGRIKIDQDAGWDHHGSPWYPRMRDPMLLCGSCIEKVFDVLKGENEG